MKSVQPPVCNCVFGAPPDLDKSQVEPIQAFKGQVPTGPLEGADFVAVAWQPSPEELEILKAGGPIYLSCLGGLPPHFLTAYFHQATHGIAS